MAWESRTRTGRKFYYRVRREGDSVKKLYFGNGPAALAAARADRRRAEQKESERRSVKELESRVWALEAGLRIIRNSCREAYHSVHHLAGFRQDRKYNWRRLPKEILALENNDPSQHPGGLKTPESLPSSIAETLELLRKGRRELIDHLRWQIQQVPQLWRHCGDLGRLTQAAWARQIAGDDDLVRESIMLVADQERRDLVENDASAAQRLLAERVVLSKMQLAYYEQLEGQNAKELIGTKLGQAVDKRLQSANHQHREATRQLQKVRQLDSEIKPRKPAAALRLFDPNQARKTA